MFKETLTGAFKTLVYLELCNKAVFVIPAT